VVDAPLPTADRGEVRVRVLASSVQYTDVLIRRHLYPQTAARRPPFVLGYDVVGEIDQLGDGVRGFQVGDRVVDLTVVGSNAAYRTLRADRTTAYQLLHRAARVQRGQRVAVGRWLKVCFTHHPTKQPACAWFELVPYPPRKIRRTSALLIRVGASPSIARRPLSRT
jgi:hypothetical protein